MSNEVWIAQEDISYEQLIEYFKLIRSLPALYQLVPMDSRVLALTAFWDICAKRVNAIKGGAIKSATGWSRYLHYVRFRIKQRVTEITSGMKISKVPEDDYIPISELDRMIFSYLYAIENQQQMSYEFDPTKSRYWKACAPQPAKTRKRQVSASEIVKTEPMKQIPVSEDKKDKNAKAPAGVRGRKRHRNAYTFDLDTAVPAIWRRSQSFMDMSDAMEYDTLFKLKKLAERSKTDPESVKKREQDRINCVRFVTLTLRANLIDSIRILSYTNVLKEILKNNPKFQKTICETPTIF